MGVANVIHRYDVANFSEYYYWQAYFVSGGTFTIDGDTVIGTDGLVLDLKISSRPVYVSGAAGLYLLGDLQPNLGPNAWTGSSSNDVQVGTDYYYGNLGMGGDPQHPHYYN